MGCPNDETLLAMVERSLAPGRFGEIEVHLDGCAHCRKAVAALALGSRSPSIAPVPFAGLDLAPNSIIHDRYEVGAELGHGGMGTVYLAHDRALGRDVALKLHRAGSGTDRLEREAVAMAKLAHPNVVSVFEVASWDDRMFVAMEYVKGGTLRSWLAEGPRTWREIVAMLCAAGNGLAAAHAAGLVHRDFKPENVLVGEEGRPRVGDFGLARTDHTPIMTDPDALAVALTLTGGIAGTPAYMAPEQLAGDVADTRCDQFAFCVVAWEALYGKRPFSGLTISALHECIERHELDRPSSPVPDRVRKVIERGLATAPGDRFPALAQLLAELRHAIAPRTTRNAIATVVAGLAIAAGAYAIYTTITTRQRAATCERAADRALAAFAPPARAMLAASFVSTGKAGGFERTAATLDRYSTALSEQAVATCRDRDLPDRTRVARETCLVERRGELSAVVAALTIPTNVARGPEAAWAIYDPSPCTAATAAPHAITDLEKLAAIEADLATARFEAGSALARPLLEEARTRKDPGLELDAMLLLGQLDQAIDPQLAVSDFNDAFALAEAQSRDLDAAIVLDHLAAAANDPAVAHRQLRLAHAKLARLGGHATIEARLDSTEAQLLLAEHDLDGAETAARASIALFEKVYGPEHPAVAAAYGVLAEILHAAGREPAAGAASRRAVELAQSTLGADRRN